MYVPVPVCVLPPLQGIFKCYVLFVLLTSCASEVSAMHNNLASATFMLATLGLLPPLRGTNLVTRAVPGSIVYLGQLSSGLVPV